MPSLICFLSRFNQEFLNRNRKIHPPAHFNRCSQERPQPTEHINTAVTVWTFVCFCLNMDRHLSKGHPKAHGFLHQCAVLWIFIYDWNIWHITTYFHLKWMWPYSTILIGFHVCKTSQVNQVSKMTNMSLLWTANQICLLSIHFQGLNGRVNSLKMICAFCACVTGCSSYSLFVWTCVSLCIFPQPSVTVLFYLFFIWQRTQYKTFLLTTSIIFIESVIIQNTWKLNPWRLHKHLCFLLYYKNLHSFFMWEKVFSWVETIFSWLQLNFLHTFM